MRASALTVGVAAAGAVLFAAQPAAARVFTGTVSGDPFPFVGRFAFGSDGGSVSVEYSYPQIATAASSLLTFTESAWNNAAPCANIAGNPSFPPLNLPMTTPAPPVAFVYNGLGSAQWEYFSLVDAAAQCSGGVFVTYTVTVTQANGDQLSYDEKGLPGVYAAFWVLLTLVQAVHVYVSYFRRPAFTPLLVRVFTIGLSLHALSNFFHMIDWAVIASKGTPNTGLAVMGALLRLSSNIAVWLLAALAAIGYGVSTYSFGDWREKSNLRGLIALSALVITYTVVALVYAAARSNPSNAAPDKGAAVAAIFVLVETILYIIWFFRRIRATIAAEVSLPKKALLRKLTYSMAALFLILPAAELLAAVVPSYEALRVTIGIDQFFTFAVYSVIAFYVLWPSRASDCFRVFDGTVAASMLGSSDFDGSGGVGGGAPVGLDEAYAYAAVAEDGNAGMKLEPTL